MKMTMFSGLVEDESDEDSDENLEQSTTKWAVAIAGRLFRPKIQGSCDGDLWWITITVYFQIRWKLGTRDI